MKWRCAHHSLAICTILTPPGAVGVARARDRLVRPNACAGYGPAFRPRSHNWPASAKTHHGLACLRGGRIVLSKLQAGMDWIVGAWTSALWAADSAWQVVAGPVTLAATGTAVLLACAALLLTGLVAWLWALHNSLKAKGAGPHPVLFTDAKPVPTALSFPVLEGRGAAPAEIEAALYMPATAIAARIREQRWTSRAVVRVFMQQLVRVDAVANAVVHERFAGAAWEAALADACVAVGRFPPHGMASAGELLESLLEGLPLPRDVAGLPWLEAHFAVLPSAQAMTAAVRQLSDAHASEGFPWVEGAPPLWGVPCSLKECFAAKDMPGCGTAGLLSRWGNASSRDAPVVHRMRAAGLVALCNTNTSELCMWYESSNRLHGRTNNVYHAGRMVGGSSGGEGAVLAGAGAAVGLGSDVGGSIRLPAHFSGVWGHKPTGGLVPNLAQYPCLESPILCTGPMTRHAADLWPLLQILAGAPCGRVRVDEAGRPVSAVLEEDLNPLMGDPAGLHVASPHHTVLGGDGGWFLPAAVPGPQQGFMRNDPSHGVAHHIAKVYAGEDTGGQLDSKGRPTLRGVELTSAVTNLLARSGSHAEPPKSAASERVAQLAGKEHWNACHPGIGSLAGLHAALARKVRVFAPSMKELEHPFGLTSATEPHVAEACSALAEQVAGALETTVQHFPMPDMPSAFDLWSALLAAEGGLLFTQLMGDTPHYQPVGVRNLLQQLWNTAHFDWAHAHDAPDQRVHPRALPTQPDQPTTRAQAIQLGRAGASSGSSSPPPELQRHGEGDTPTERIAGHPAPFTLPGIGLALIETIPRTLMPSAVERFKQRGLRLRQDLTRALGTNGVLILPTQPTTAPAHSVALWRIHNAGYTMLFNATLNPVTVVPAGLDGDGLPAGVQVVGAMGSDALTVSVGVLAEALGTRFGWTPPTLLTSAAPHPALAAK